MTERPPASEQITAEVTAWPGVETGPGRFGATAFTIGRHEIGHLHGDHAAHFGFPRDVCARLKAEGRVVEHPALPHSAGAAARRIESDDDVRDVIAPLRLNYERVVARHGVPA
jgi:hypothetical protein